MGRAASHKGWPGSGIRSKCRQLRLETPDAFPTGRRIADTEQEGPDHLVVEIGLGIAELLVETIDEVVPSPRGDGEEFLESCFLPLDSGLHVVGFHNFTLCSE